MPDEQPSVLRFPPEESMPPAGTCYLDPTIRRHSKQPSIQRGNRRFLHGLCSGPDGKVIYKTIGSVDLLEMRRKILAAMPSDYVGFNKYWESGN